MGVDAWVAAGLVLVAFCAGFVDAIAGGGGLLQLPALLAAVPDLGVALGVNKVASLCGTTAAIVRYAKGGHVAWRDALRAGPIAFVAAFAAAAAVLAAAARAPALLKPAFAVCFIALAANQVRLALRRRRATETTSPRAPRVAVGLAFVGAIALYDGFVGPGTGMFLFWAFSTWFALAPMDATGTTKVVNGCTNAGALAAFLLFGAIRWPLALAMAGGNTLGGLLGAGLAIRRGARFVRLVTAAMSVAASAWLLIRWLEG